MTMHVVVLNHFALPRNSAGGTRHVELFGRLGEEFRCEVIAGNRNLFDQSRVRSSGLLTTVPVSPYSGNGLSRILNWVSFMFTGGARALTRRRVDVVFGSSPHMLAALAGWMVATLRRAPFILEVRDLWPQILVDAGSLRETSALYRLLKGLERFLYARATKIVVLAEGSIPSIVGEGVDAEKIVFIPNGADPSDFQSTEDRDRVRERFGFDRFTAVYAGAHGPANGLDLVLDAAAELDADGDIEIVLYGDGVSKAELVEAAQRRGVRSLRFEAPVPKASIVDVFAAADVGLHSLADVELFKHGVSPNKLYDYMAAGLPALTNTGGDVGRMVTDAGAGRAVGPSGIADGLRELRDLTSHERLAIGERGRAFMNAHRSRSAMACRLGEVLTSVL